MNLYTLDTIKQARIAGLNDKAEGYTFQPAFRKGTQEYDAYKQGYYNDSHKLHTSNRTH